MDTLKRLGLKVLAAIVSVLFTSFVTSVTVGVLNLHDFRLVVAVIMGALMVTPFYEILTRGEDLE